MDTFKIPESVPQDLLLIHDIIGVLPTANPTVSIKPHDVEDDCIDSSDSEDGSEAEIEADLTAIDNEDYSPKSTPASGSNFDDSVVDSGSDSDSDSSSDSDQSGDKAFVNLDVDDDEDGGSVPTSGSYFQTKNEVVETNIVVPDITQVGPEEVLEKVGEVMSIMGNTVIVNGLPSENSNRGSDRALDSDTLLVFHDRKVLGYIYETFGPTTQPLYQVKFNTQFPLDPETIQVSREVFHVPARSNFVFLSQIMRAKGSDASNVHDEEPAEHELEFSDDEAEAAYKASMKRRRGESRAPSVAASSRQTSPTPSQMYDQDMDQGRHFSQNPYDEHGPYDIGFSAGPSRPPPVPYDDPYSDEYTSSSMIPPTSASQTAWDGSNRREKPSVSSRSRRGQDRDRGDAGGRSRGRGRGRGDRGGFRGLARSDNYTRKSNNGSWTGSPAPSQGITEDYGRQARSLSPTSFAIARATGQLPDGPSSYNNQNNSHLSSQTPNPLGTWGYQNSFQPNPMFPFGTTGYSPGFVQPHINPRFANTFGMNMGMVAHSQYTPQNTVATNYRPANRTDEWSVSSGQGATPDIGDKSLK
ncbi:hypothetical protein C0993_009471 [Termitomyces sp. T159_Od127]|nr:hypothetical protein C0993_009471 [Termitomyces sp. T159_Od127]